jgi:hypothetical protein
MRDLIRYSKIFLANDLLLSTKNAKKNNVRKELTELIAQMEFKLLLPLVDNNPQEAIAGFLKLSREYPETTYGKKASEKAAELKNQNK